MVQRPRPAGAEIGGAHGAGAGIGAAAPGRWRPGPRRRKRPTPPGAGRGEAPGPSATGPASGGDESPGPFAVEPPDGRGRTGRTSRTGCTWRGRRYALGPIPPPVAGAYLFHRGRRRDVGGRRSRRDVGVGPPSPPARQQYRRGGSAHPGVTWAGLGRPPQPGGPGEATRRPQAPKLASDIDEPGPRAESPATLHSLLSFRFGPVGAVAGARAILLSDPRPGPRPAGSTPAGAATRPPRGCRFAGRGAGRPASGERRGTAPPRPSAGRALPLDLGPISRPSYAR